MKNVKKLLNLIISNKKNLEKSLPQLKKGKKQILKGVFAGKNVKIEPNVFFDTSVGEIVVGSDTRIKSCSVLRGPLIIGNNCVINSFAEISRSQIGNVCKIGGEVEECVINDYSNKQHYGYLGHSYVGSWVNIGGGTSVATLKNTYSSIKMGDIDTGLMFLGCIFGDYSKTAINTSIFCGKIIGASAHLYGTVTEDVPAFTSHVAPGQLYELPLEVAEKIQRAMMKRRNLEFSKKDSENFKKLFNETAEERKEAGVKKDKLSFK